MNPNIPTGEVELQVDELEILSTSPPLPFQLDEEGVDETLRIRYRWLDLRRERLQRNLRLRAQMVSIIRRVMEGAGFLDIETPILFKPTPEGARDFLVPSRLQQGKFFALPQSPQILKQLLVIAGFERYYQIARCFRDEDLRADRSNELTQLDVEMAFPDVEFIIALMEEMVQAIWRETIGVELETPFQRLTYADAMLSYGTDKPDLRFGLEIQDATELTRSSQFKVFAGAPCGSLPDCAAGVSRGPTSNGSRSSPRSGARRGSPTSSTARTARRARRSRSSCPRTSSRRSAPTRARPCSSAPTSPTRSRACSERSARVSGMSSGSSTRTRFAGPGSPTSRCSTGRRRTSGWAAEHHPFTRPAPESEPMLDKDPGRAHRGRVRPHRQRRGARRRLAPDPRVGAPGEGLRHPAHLARGAAGAASASCSRRWTWARRPTAASRSASTGW